MVVTAFPRLPQSLPLILKLCCGVTLAAGLLYASHAAGAWSGIDPSQWNADDVYQVLHKSPWIKSLKVSFAAGSLLNSQTSAPNSTTRNWPGGVPNGAPGSLGRQRSQRTYDSAGSQSTSSAPLPSSSRPEQVDIQWQSALPMQIAAAKKQNPNVDLSTIKPMPEYAIALIGLPETAVGAPAASIDSDKTIDGDVEQRMRDRIKASASLLRSGHSPLTPSRVEVNQGVDGRIVIYFPKSDPIELKDKTVEFRLAAGREQIHAKFVLKGMEFQGKLAL